MVFFSGAVLFSSLVCSRSPSSTHFCRNFHLKCFHLYMFYLCSSSSWNAQCPSSERETLHTGSSTDSHSDTNQRFSVCLSVCLAACLAGDTLITSGPVRARLGQSASLSCKVKDGVHVTISVWSRCSDSSSIAVFAPEHKGPKRENSIHISEPYTGHVSITEYHTLTVNQLQDGDFGEYCCKMSTFPDGGLEGRVQLLRDESEDDDKEVDKGPPAGINNTLIHNITHTHTEIWRECKMRWGAFCSLTGYFTFMSKFRVYMKKVKDSGWLAIKQSVNKTIKVPPAPYSGFILHPEGRGVGWGSVESKESKLSSKH